MLRKVRAFVHILVLPFSRYWSSFCPGPCSQCWRCSSDQKTKVGVRARMWLVLWGTARKPEAGKEGPKGKCVGMRWKGGREGNRWAGGTQPSAIEGLGFYADGEGKHFHGFGQRLICQQDHTGAVLRMESSGQGQMQCDRWGGLFVTCRQDCVCLGYRWEHGVWWDEAGCGHILMAHLVGLALGLDIG